jgi:hypothetical protein
LRTAKQPTNQRVLGALLLGGLLIRLAIAPWIRGSRHDVEVMLSWAGSLINHPLSRFYAVAETPDHLPGDLWFLWGIAHIFSALGGENLDGVLFRAMLKTLPAIADVIVGLMLYVIVRRLRDHRAALLTAAFYLFNPASIFLTAVWGQWDALSMAMVLFATWLFLERGDRWLWGIPLLAWVLMIKPQLALLIPLLLLIPFRDTLDRQKAWKPAIGFLAPRFALAVVAAIATIGLIGLPFRVGLPGVPARWSLLDRMDYAINFWQYTTMGASNFWMIPIGSLKRQSDVSSEFLGLSAHGWGNLLFAVLYAFILITVWRRWVAKSPAPALFWGMLATSFAVFMVPTRVHERYIFPTFVFAILLVGRSGFERRSLGLAVAVSTTFFLNLLGVYRHIFDPIDPFFSVLAVANAALFVFVLVAPLRERGAVSKVGEGVRCGITA